MLYFWFFYPKLIAMTLPALQKEVRELIGKNKTEEALESLKERILPENINLILLFSQYGQIKDNIPMGITSSSQSSLNLNTLNNNILGFINTLSNEDLIPKDYDETTITKGINVDTLLTRAINHAKHKNFKRAIEYYNQVLTITPNDTKIIARLSNCYRKNNEQQKAIELLKAARQIDKKDSKLIDILAKSYREINQPYAALDALKVGLQNEPENEFFHINRFFIHFFFLHEFEVSENIKSQFEQSFNTQLFKNQDKRDIFSLFLNNKGTLKSLKGSDEIIKKFIEQSIHIKAFHLAADMLIKVEKRIAYKAWAIETKKSIPQKFLKRPKNKQNIPKIEPDGYEKVLTGLMGLKVTNLHLFTDNSLIDAFEKIMHTWQNDDFHKSQPQNNEFHFFWMNNTLILAFKPSHLWHILAKISDEFLQNHSNEFSLRIALHHGHVHWININETAILLGKTMDNFWALVDSCPDNAILLSDAYHSNIISPKKQEFRAFRFEPYQVINDTHSFLMVEK